MPPRTITGRCATCASLTGSQASASFRIVSIDESGSEGTAAESSGSAVQPEPTPAGKLAPHLRIWNWFWRGQEMRKWLAPKPAEQATFRLRAKLATDVARRTEDSAEPFEDSVDAILCDLYRQSIHWSRLGLAFSESGAASAPKAWSAIDSVLLQRAVPNADLLTQVQSAADASSYEHFESLSVEERSRLLPGLRSLSLALLAEQEVDKRALEALWTQRIVRVGLILGLFAALAIVGLKASDGAEEAGDLAKGKPWRASSAYSGVTACTSPQQECAQSPDFFFHTQEELKAWLEIDLGSELTFSGVRVVNRRDCCAERAAPLIIEVSSDQQHWRKVARRDAVFSSWLAKFAPVSARYVRVHLEKRESLHLQRVRVLR